VGVYSTPVAAGTGTVTTAYALYNNLIVGSASGQTPTVTTAYGIYNKIDRNYGTLTSAYGIFNLLEGTITNKVGVINQGNAEIDFGVVDGENLILGHYNTTTLTATPRLTIASTGDITVTGSITLPADPTLAMHAATKQYVDTVGAGLSNYKDAVRVATTSAGTLSTSFANGQVVDGVTLATNDRILIKNQATGSENGIYVVNASGAPTRADDANNTPTVGEVTTGMYVFVSSGTTNANTAWVLSTTGTITLGVTSLTFVQFMSTPTIAAGAGLTQSGAVLNVGTVSATRIVVNADNIDLATVVTAGSGNNITFDAYGRVTSASTVAYLTAEADTLQSVCARGSSTTTSVTISGGILTLSNATSNIINFGTTGNGVPTFTTRSAGTKIVLRDTLGAAAVDYAIGADSGTADLWFSTPTTGSNGFSWYGGTTQIARLTGTGQLTLDAGVITGALSQMVNGVAGSGTEIIEFKPTDYGTGKPYLYIKNGASATEMQIGLWDGTNGNGTVTLTSQYTKVTGLLQATNNVIINSSAGATEGAQIIMAYKTITGLTGQSNSTWNIDVDATDSLRMFAKTAAGGTSAIMSIAETGDVTINGMIYANDEITTGKGYQISPTTSFNVTDATPALHYIGRLKTGMATLRIGVTGYSGYNSAEFVLTLEYAAAGTDNSHTGFAVLDLKKSSGFTELNSYIIHQWVDTSTVDIFVRYTGYAAQTQTISYAVTGYYTTVTSNGFTVPTAPITPTATANNTAYPGFSNEDGQIKIPSEAGASLGFLKIATDGSLSSDTTTYLSAEADTLATVTGRGATTGTACGFTNTTDITTGTFTSGSLYTSGGMSISKSLQVGGSAIYVSSGTSSALMQLSGTSSSVQQSIRFYNSGFAIDQKISEIIQYPTTGDFRLRFLNDAGSAESSFLIATRTAATYTTSTLTLCSGSGTVGIAATPPSNSTTSKLFVSGDISIPGANRSILGNLYYDTGFKYGAAGYAWGIRENNAGLLQFIRSSSSGASAGSAATMTMDTTYSLITGNWSFGSITDLGAKVGVQGGILRTGALSTTNAAWANVGPFFNSVGNSITNTDGTGTIAAQSAHSFQTPTFASTNVVTVTNASNLYIGGAPTAGTNTTITNAYSLYVASGAAYFAGALTGASFNSITGLASTNPLANGTAAVGTSTLVARQDHVHPISALTISNGLSGTSYNGSSAVTIAVSAPNNTTSATYYPVFATSQGTSVVLGTTSSFTYNPSTGTLIVNDLRQNVPTPVTSGTGAGAYTTTATTQVVVDTFDATIYRSGTWKVQITSGTSYQTSRIDVVHNGASTWETEYAQMFSGSNLGSFTTDWNTSSVRLLFTAASATSTTVKVILTDLIPL